MPRGLSISRAASTRAQPQARGLCVQWRPTSSRPATRCWRIVRRAQQSQDTQDRREEETGAQFSEEQLQKLMELRKGQLGSEAAEKNWFQGAIEEARLTEWPPFGKALIQTLLVTAIVGGTSLLLFGLNTLLAELSQTYYSSIS